METIREEGDNKSRKYYGDDEDINSEDSHRSKKSRRSRHSHGSGRHSHHSKTRHSRKSHDSQSSIPNHIVRDLQSEVTDPKHHHDGDYEFDDDDVFDDDDDNDYNYSQSQRHRHRHKHDHDHRNDQRHAQKHAQRNNQRHPTMNHKFVPRLQNKSRMLNGGEHNNQQNQNVHVSKSRQWANIPPNNLNIKEVWSKIIDPSSWWCVGTVTVLAIVLSVFIILYFKPSIVLDQSNTNKKGSLDWKKVLAVCFIVGIAVFGATTYLRYKLQN